MRPACSLKTKNWTDSPVRSTVDPFACVMPPFVHANQTPGATYYQNLDLIGRYKAEWNRLAEARTKEWREFANRRRDVNAAIEKDKDVRQKNVDQIARNKESIVKLNRSIGIYQ